LNKIVPKKLLTIFGILFILAVGVVQVGACGLVIISMLLDTLELGLYLFSGGTVDNLICTEGL